MSSSSELSYSQNKNIAGIQMPRLHDDVFIGRSRPHPLATASRDFMMKSSSADHGRIPSLAFRCRDVTCCLQALKLSV
jgi:hypothetical protein